MANITPHLNPIQIETIVQSLGVSEGCVSAIGGLANGLLQIFYPVGSIMYSMLTPTQLAAQLYNPTPQTWVLADGGDVSGSAYATLTGNNFAPDLRGIFVRGKNGPTSNINPDGDLPLGTYTADKFGSHTHLYSSQQLLIAPNFVAGQVRLETRIDTPAFYNVSVPTGSSTGNESAPTNVTVNIYVRIN